MQRDDRSRRTPRQGHSVGAEARLHPITAVSLVDQATVQIRRSIIRGELKAGDRFSIIELANRLDISHIPVREALRRLESEGSVDLNR